MLLCKCVYGLTWEVTETSRLKPLRQIISTDNSGGSISATNRGLYSRRSDYECFYFVKGSIHTGELTEVNK